MNKKGLNSQQYSPNLTETESLVLSLLTEDFFTPRQIAYRREVSVQSVYKIIKNLKEKGAINQQDLQGLKKSTHVIKKGLKIWRYHGLHFLVKPFYFFPRYYKYKDRGNLYNYGDWVFKLHNKNIEVQSKALIDFCDTDKYKAIKKGEDSFNKALNHASNRFGFEIYKNGNLNIKLVNHHLAYGKSDIAKSTGENYLRVKGEDGKTWFMIDKSKGFIEHEYIGKDILSNSETVEDFFNDIKKGQWTDFKQIIYLMTTEYSNNIKSHLEVLNKMSKTLDKIQRGLDKYEKKKK